MRASISVDSHLDARPIFTGLGKLPDPISAYIDVRERRTRNCTSEKGNKPGGAASGRCGALDDASRGTKAFGDRDLLGGVMWRTFFVVAVPLRSLTFSALANNQ
jgi:hypothetical protein